MKCPTCGDPMIVVEHESIELDYCTNCAGVWFDEGELELLLEGMDLDRSMLSLDRILTSPEARTREKKRHCPICNRFMKKATVGHDPEVLIDACDRGDGLWFDGGQVGQVIQQLNRIDVRSEDSQDRLITFLGDVFQIKE